jgi:UDP-N-acetylmuramate--alanine ligase
VWDSLGSNAVLGRGDYFVAEADESDASFLYLRPQVAVLTNLDREHLDFYRDLAHIQETFGRYLEQLPPQAQVVAWADDPHLTPLLRGLKQPLWTYSLQPGTDFGATDIRLQGLQSRYRLWHQGREIGVITLPLTGRHYVLNSLAACAVAHSLGVDFSVWRQGLSNLGQIQRRCQVKGEVQGIMVVDDYGHHPTEINTTLTALAQSFPDRRLVVVFQPHRYSRTRALLPEFFPVFQQAAVVFVTEIYSAGETVLPGLSGRQIYDGIKRQGHPEVHFIPEKQDLLNGLLAQVQPGDVVLTLGAGDIWRLGEELLVQLAGAPLEARMLWPQGEPKRQGALA